MTKTLSPSWDLLEGGVALEKGSVFDPLPRSPGLVVLPAHCVIRDDGCLVAPSGVLHEARLVFGGDVSAHLGEIVRTLNINAIYGFRLIYDPHKSGVGLALFQTQYGWWEPPKRHLVDTSAGTFREWIHGENGIHVRMAAQPGVDWGWLRKLTRRERSKVTLVQRTRRPAARGGFLATEPYQDSGR